MHNGEKRMKAWQTILIVAVAATIMVIAGTLAYLYFSPTPRLIISTTSSLYDTGLLDAIKAQYEATHKVDIYFSAQGTGVALANAAAGEADLVLVHAPSSEYPYLANGTLVCRKIIAWNYFTIVGPSSDPAKITGKNATEALKSILAYGRSQTGTIVWFSRNDGSGTYTKEVSLWKSAGYNWTTISKETWFTSTGQTMGPTLQVTDGVNSGIGAYTLSDLGTYLKFYESAAISLAALVEGPDYSLLNVYSVYAVNPQKVSNASFSQAIAFIEWLVSDSGQQVINSYGNYSQPLFYGAVQPLKNNSPQPDVSWIKQYAFFDGTECPTQYRAGQDQLYPP
jgi:tungstate transport system substrate-binding protein